MSSYPQRKIVTSGNPTRFHRSNTSISDEAVVIGNRYFPMRDVFGAEVNTIYSPLKSTQEVLRSNLPIVLGLGTLGTIFTFLDWPGNFLMIGWAILNLRPIVRHFLKRQDAIEYKVVLHMRNESVEVITAWNISYLKQITDEINRRVLSTGFLAIESEHIHE